ncbi:hypothetical protein DFH11DRAFT_1543295 [Phellopilus nigrolimitatus]|nr:hypothetical protein DFH11DRAFT_1543295 [Phellopilus nigrolimitatus]
MPDIAPPTSDSCTAERVWLGVATPAIASSWLAEGQQVSDGAALEEGTQARNSICIQIKRNTWTWIPKLLAIRKTALSTTHPWTASFPAPAILKGARREPLAHPWCAAAASSSSSSVQSTAPAHWRWSMTQGDIQLEQELSSSPSSDDGPGNASTLVHKAQKALQNKGHAAETHAALLAEAKASRKDVPYEARRGTHARRPRKVQDIVLEHDVSCILQTLVKYSSQAERDAVAARRVLRDEAHPQLPRSLRGDRARVPRGRHAYELHANANERPFLFRDIYVREDALFGEPVARTRREFQQCERILAAVKGRVQLV